MIKYIVSYKDKNNIRVVSSTSEIATNMFIKKLRNSRLVSEIDIKVEK